MQLMSNVRSVMPISTIAIRLLVIWSVALGIIAIASVGCSGLQGIALLLLAGGGYGMGALVQDTFGQAGAFAVSFFLGAGALSSFAVGVARPKYWLISTAVCAVAGGTIAALLVHNSPLETPAHRILSTIGQGCS